MRLEGGASLAEMVPVLGSVHGAALCQGLLHPSQPGKARTGGTYIPF